MKQINNQVHCSNKIGQSKKARKTGVSRNSNFEIHDSNLPPKLNVISNIIIPYEDIGLPLCIESFKDSSNVLPENAKSPPYTDLGKDEKIDSNVDPQFCVVIACDIFKHLRESEVKKKPALNYMERIQLNINASMRSILIVWLVEIGIFKAM